MPSPGQKAPISVQRAFVVHFRLSSNVEQGPFEGRVTHVVSGQAAHFSSLDELLEFMAQVLARSPNAESSERR